MLIYCVISRKELHITDNLDFWMKEVKLCNPAKFIQTTIPTAPRRTLFGSILNSQTVITHNLHGETLIKAIFEAEYWRDALDEVEIPEFFSSQLWPTSSQTTPLERRRLRAATYLLSDQLQDGTFRPPFSRVQLTSAEKWFLRRNAAAWTDYPIDFNFRYNGSPLYFWIQDNPKSLFEESAIFGRDVSLVDDFTKLKYIEARLSVKAWRRFRWENIGGYDMIISNIVSCEKWIRYTPQMASSIFESMARLSATPRTHNGIDYRNLHLMKWKAYVGLSGIAESKSQFVDTLRELNRIAKDLPTVPKDLNLKVLPIGLYLNDLLVQLLFFAAGNETTTEVFEYLIQRHNVTKEDMQSLRAAAPRRLSIHYFASERIKQSGLLPTETGNMTS